MKTLCRVLVVLLAWSVCPARAQVDGEVLGVSPGSSSAMAVLGDMLCLGSGHTLYLEDLQDPASPVPLGSIRLQDEPCSIALYDSVAYVGLVPSGLCIVDMRNPRDPQLLQCVDSPRSNLLLIRNDHLYSLEFRLALRSYSLEDPSDPQYTGYFPSEADWMAGNDRHLFLGSQENGIQILSLENPQDPALVETLDVTGSFFPRGFAVTDSVLITCGFQDSLRVFDIWDPSQMEPLSVLPPYSNYGSIETFGNSFLLTTPEDGVMLGDLSDPRNPAVIGSLPVDGFSMITFDNSLVAFMEYGDTLSRYDLSDVANPVLRGETVRYFTNHSFAAMGRLAVSAGVSGVHLEDFSEPDHPRWLGRIRVPGSPRWITVVDSVAFVGTQGAGLQGLDLGDPQNPVLFPLDVSGNVVWMEPDGSTLNLLYDTGILRSIDVSNPRAPTDIRALATTLSPWSMTIEGRIACEYDDFDFRIWDLDAVSGPVELFVEYECDFITNLVLDDNLLYRIDEVSGLRIHDIHDPEVPVQLGTLGGLGPGTDLQHEGDRLYSCNEGGVVSVLDVRDPANPALLARAGVCYDPVGVRTGSGLVFVPTQFGGIWALRFPGLFPPDPAELAIASWGPDVILSWAQPEAAEWNVYRLGSPFELPGPSNLVATVSAPTWTDPHALNRAAAFYRVTAVME